MTACTSAPPPPARSWGCPVFTVGGVIAPGQKIMGYRAGRHTLVINAMIESEERQ